MLGEKFKGNVQTLTGQHYKLTISLGDGELYKPLADLITDTSLKSKLEDDIQSADDGILDFRFSLQNTYWGRRFDHHENYLDAIADKVNGEIMEPVRQANMDFNGLLDSVMVECNYSGDGADLTTRSLSDLCGGSMPENLVPSIDRAMASQAKYKQRLETEMNAVG